MVKRKKSSKQIDWVEGYKFFRPTYKKFTEMLKQLLKKLISESGIKRHLIESRTKYYLYFFGKDFPCREDIEASY